MLWNRMLMSTSSMVKHFNWNATLPTSLISYYKFDTDWTVNDETATWNNLTIWWATYTASGKINWWYSLSNWDYFQDATATWIDTWNWDLSVSFWAKWGNWTWLSSWNNHWGWVIWSAENANIYPLGFQRWSTWNDYVYLVQHDWTYTASAEAQVKDDWNWHHYVAKRSASWATMELYEDNVRIINSTWLTWRSPSWTNSRITINWNLGQAPTYMFTATWIVDEFWLWSKDLTTTEITALYNTWTGLSY